MASYPSFSFCLAVSPSACIEQMYSEGRYLLLMHPLCVRIGCLLRRPALVYSQITIFSFFIFAPLSFVLDLSQSCARKVLRGTVRLTVYNYANYHISGQSNVWTDLLGLSNLYVHPGMILHGPFKSKINNIHIIFDFDILIIQVDTVIQSL